MVELAKKTLFSLPGYKLLAEMFFTENNLHINMCYFNPIK